MQRKKTDLRNERWNAQQNGRLRTAFNALVSVPEKMKVPFINSGNSRERVDLRESSYP